MGPQSHCGHLPRPQPLQVWVLDILDEFLLFDYYARSNFSNLSPLQDKEAVILAPRTFPGGPGAATILVAKRKIFRGLTLNPKSETRNPKPETRNPKPEAQNPKPEARSPKPETQENKTETRA